MAARSAAAIDYDGLDEGALARLAKAGDPEAFRAVMQRYNQRLFRMARSVMRDDSEAEDVLQEAYVRAFSAIGRFREEASLLTWLTRIVINEARGRLRRRRPTVGLEMIETEKDGAVVPFARPAPASPEADAARAEARRLMEAAIDELPEAFRLVFILRELEECTVEETAERLGLRPETVKTRLFRARKLLRRALEEKLMSSLAEAFPFLGVRCQRITEAVLARLAEAKRD
jgi:RNA polymerase sigma-70 factor (ECF subfamily)